MDPEKIHYNYCEVLTTTPWPPNSRVLVTGANGYVAQRLIPELIRREYWVRCMVRTRHTPFFLKHPRIEVVYADCLIKEQLQPVLNGIEFAYYLIHCMRAKNSDFSDLDRKAAQCFMEVAEEADIKKGYLPGGVGGDQCPPVQAPAKPNGSRRSFISKFHSRRSPARGDHYRDGEHFL